MKKILLTFFVQVVSIVIFAQVLDFSINGFASLNGGTTGGQGGTAVTVTNLTQFKKYVGNATPYIIYVNGTLEGAGGGELVEIGSNKSIIGIGNNAKVLKVQFYCKNSKNLIIRNLMFSMQGSTLGSDADCISIATTSSNICQNIWIDHCTFDNFVNPIYNASASVKDQYDGLLDIKKNTEYITISWCVFKNHYKGILVGYTSTDTYDRKITMHHNAFINIGSRTPSYRGGTAHIYNNYWEGCYDASANKYFSTGINTRENACLYVESNYFKNMDKTVYCAIDDVVLEGFAFYKNNIFENANAETAKTCSSFTPPYSVTVDNAADVPTIVNTYAGVGIIQDPVNIPDPENDPGTVTIAAPYLNEATQLNETGFSISWNSVTDAVSYVVNASYEAEGSSEGTIFKETFNALNINDNLTSGKTDNPTNLFFLENGGSLTNVKSTEEGSVQMTGTRFCIGRMDLTGSLILTIKVKTTASSTGRFQIALDAAGTSGVSNLLNAVCGTDITTEYKSISIPFSAGTASSYIQFRTESTATVLIDEITITTADAAPSTITLPSVNTSNTNFTFEGLITGTEYKVWVIAKDSQGNSSTSSNAVYVTPTIETSVENINNHQISVFSTVNGIRVKNAKNYSVSIYSLTGAKILTKTVKSDDETIDANLSSNIYIATVNNQRFKVVVQ